MPVEPSTPAPVDSATVNLADLAVEKDKPNAGARAANPPAAAAGKPAAKPAEKPAEKPAAKPVEKPAEKPAAKPTAEPKPTAKKPGGFVPPPVTDPGF